MPRFTWLEGAPVDGPTIKRHMQALRTIGDPYSDADIAGAAEAVRGKTELDALVAYLQGLGRAAPKGD
jgi:cytochrome c oxidase cbb3-type subunit 2